MTTFLEGVALVTGAGQGVGREVSRLLARQGVPVLVNDYFADRAAEVVSEIRDEGGLAESVVADVTRVEQFAAALDAATEQLGPVSMLVNNAGNAGATGSIAEPLPFWETDPDDWGRWLDVNLLGVLNVTRSVLPSMVAASRGRIVTVISDAGRVGEPHLAVYSAAKAGAAGFSRAVARAVGRHEITVNCVALGATATPTTAALGRLSEDDAAAQRMLRSYIIRRFGTPGDAAAAIAFLLSSEAGWITAQTLPVNGGYSVAL